MADIVKNSAMPTPTGKASANPISRSVAFFQESVEEVKKVHFPTRQETIQASMVVLAMIVVFSIFLGLVDYVIGNVMRAVLT